MPLEPPEERLFDSKEELLEYCIRQGASQGYAVTKAGGGDSRKVYLKCDRGGAYSSQSLGLRSSSSRRQSCPFKLYGAATKKDGGRWRLTVKNSAHNHDASDNLAAHPSLRRLNDLQLKILQPLNSANVPARHLMTALRTADPGVLFLAKDIYNSRYKTRKEQLDGRTPIQALLADLNAREYALKYSCDKEGRVTHLFVAHPSAIQLTRTFCYTLLMDCTY